MRTADDAGRTAVRLDLASGTVILHGQEVELPLREFRLLSVLVQRVGQPVATRDLIEAVWPEDAEWTPKEDLYVLVSKLRRQIDGPTKLGDCIRNRRGFGYLLDLDPSDVEVVTSPSETDAVDPAQQQVDTVPRPPGDPDPLETSTVDVASRRPGLSASALVIAAVLAGSWVAGYTASRVISGPHVSQDESLDAPQGIPETRLSPSPEDAAWDRNDRRQSKSKHQSDKKSPGRRSSQGEALAVSGGSPSQQTSEGSKEESAEGQQVRKTEQLPPAPTNYLYHLFNQETGDHFVTTDPGVASQYEGQGYQGGPVGRVYSYAEKNTKPIATNSGTAYIFASSTAKTEPASNIKALYYATNDEGDFFYTTSAAQASQQGWNASVIGYVRSL